MAEIPIHIGNYREKRGTELMKVWYKNHDKFITELFRAEPHPMSIPEGMYFIRPITGGKTMKRKIVTINILYDNGRPYKINNVIKTNLPLKDCEIDVSQTNKFTVGRFIKGVFTTVEIPLGDVAALEIKFNNGDIVFKKLKPCAVYKTNLYKNHR